MEEPEYIEIECWIKVDSDRNVAVRSDEAELVEADYIGQTSETYCITVKVPVPVARRASVVIPPKSHAEPLVAVE